MGHEARLDGHTSRPDIGQEYRPASRQGVVALEEQGFRSLAASLNRVSTISQNPDFVARNEELPRIASRGGLRLREREPGQVPHVLASDAEIRIHAGGFHSGAKSSQPLRAGRAISGLPTSAIVTARWSAEINRLGEACSIHFAYFLMFA